MDPEASSTPVVVPGLLTVMEAAGVLRVGRTTAYDLVDKYFTTDGADGMPCLRVGGQLRLSRVLFEEWLGFRITVWPPVEEPDVDDISIAQPVIEALEANDVYFTRTLQSAGAHRTLATEPAFEGLLDRVVLSSLLDHLAPRQRKILQMRYFIAASLDQLNRYTIDGSDEAPTRPGL